MRLYVQKDAAPGVGTGQFSKSLEKVKQANGQSYPSGVLINRGENLYALAADQSAYRTPLRPSAEQARLDCLVIPTARDFIANRKNIRKIMQAASEHRVGLLLFLCSGEARKKDLVPLAEQFPELEWMAIEGPFLHSVHYEFETASSIIAKGHTWDVSPKRNFALVLARLLGWRSMFFCDDDVELTAGVLAKSADLLYSTDAAAVGFSVREFPDQSVVVHASQWVHAPIDSFIGGGSLAIKTDRSFLPFFPHIYNEDWLFLILYCLQGKNALTWAGTLRQKRYNPFRSTNRARMEEFGDLLGESLMLLAIHAQQEESGPRDYHEILDYIRQVAHEYFWEKEINQRALFIRQTQDKVRLRKLPSRKKRQLLESLDMSLTTLLGKDGVRGLRGTDLAAWIQAWAHDMKGWNKMLAELPRLNSITSALSYLDLPNAYLYGKPRTDNIIPPVSRSATPATVGLPGIAADIPRAAHEIIGLRSTLIMQELAAAQHLDIATIEESTKRLRFDRPTDMRTAMYAQPPDFTICMLVAAHEPPGKLSGSLRAIREYTANRPAVQLILWVYDQDGASAAATEQYRNNIVAQLLPELSGSNLYIRSEVLRAEGLGLDELITTGVRGAAFAYWQACIKTTHQMYIVNSSNELLRTCTVADFSQQQHTVAHGSLLTHIGSAARDQAASPLTTEQDEQAIDQARQRLLSPKRLWQWPTLQFGSRPVTRAARQLAKSKTSWVQADDMAYRYHVYDAQGTIALRAIQKIYIIPVAFRPTLPSDNYILARDILDRIARYTHRHQQECLVLVYGNSSTSWTELEQFQQELMDIVLKQHTGTMLFTSLAIHPEQASGLKQTKSIATAATTYRHWLVDTHIEVLPQLSWLHL